MNEKKCEKSWHVVYMEAHKVKGHCSSPKISSQENSQQFS